MKREEKNLLSTQRILEAAIREFSEKGYGAASLNTICAENSISKGIIYHYFKDKDELYLACAADCFDKLTVCLSRADIGAAKTVEQKLRVYFDARLQFFVEQPMYLGIFLNAVLSQPAHLAAKLSARRKGFDDFNISTLTELLESAGLREGLSASVIAEDMRMYMDYFNARFRTALAEAQSPEQALREHEERCHRQLSIWLYGALGGKNENR